MAKFGPEWRGGERFEYCGQRQSEGQAERLAASYTLFRSSFTLVSLHAYCIMLSLIGYTHILVCCRTHPCSWMHLLLHVTQHS